MILAFLRATDVRALSKDERVKQLGDLRQELMHERGVAAMGGSPPSPGKIRQIRRQIARLLTIQREDELVKLGRMQPRTSRKKNPRARTAATASTAAPKKPKE